jgi:hypothetical protein
MRTGREPGYHLAREVGLPLENTSPEVLEIEVRSSPLQYLDLLVRDAGGPVISDSFYGDLFLPLAEPYTLRLPPGEKYIGPVSLLGNVPEDKRLPGKYSVQAVYEYRGLRALSEPLSVELPGQRLNPPRVRMGDQAAPRSPGEWSFGGRLARNRNGMTGPRIRERAMQQAVDNVATLGGGSGASASASIRKQPARPSCTAANELPATVPLTGE